MKPKQPKLLRLLSLIQMGKFFSHYGMRALLVLYLVKALQYGDTQAFGMSAVFVGLFPLGGILGGLIADHFLGLRRAVFIGSWLLLAGYLCLPFQGGLTIGLSLIVLGGSLFASNITALLGAAYGEEDPRRERGFTLFYMMQNLGALISTALCGYIAMRFGFSTAFIVAASGMLFSTFCLFFCRGQLEQVDNSPIQPKTGLLLPLSLGIAGLIVAIILLYASMAMIVLPWLTMGVFFYFARLLLKTPELPKRMVYILFVYLGALILYYAAEDQIASSLMLFAEREASHTLFGWTIPSAIIMSVNPVTILVMGFFMKHSGRRRIILPFILTAAAFGTIALLCALNSGFSILGIMGIVVVLSLAELLIGPIVMSFASELASKGRAGTVMGMVPLAFSLAFLLGGRLSQMVALDGTTSSLSVYGAGFGKMACIVFTGGCVLTLLKRKYSAKKALAKP